jgi:CheY-like chemotaxis protein
MSGGNERKQSAMVATILVADDEPNDIFFLKHAFAKAGRGYRIMDVPDGEKAIGYLSGSAPYADRSRFPLPTLLLLDLKMPKVNGFEVLAWLQREKRLDSLKVVVLSSSGLPSDKQKAASLGAHDYRVKPADIAEMLILVNELSARWLG